MPTAKSVLLYFNAKELREFQESNLPVVIQIEILQQRLTGVEVPACLRSDNHSHHI